MAAQAKVHNRPVFYSTEQRGKFTNLVAMEYAPEPLGQTEEPTDLPPVPNDDDLPFTFLPPILIPFLVAFLGIGAMLNV